MYFIAKFAILHVSFDMFYFILGRIMISGFSEHITLL